jgi:hypothetical protein
MLNHRALCLALLALLVAGCATRPLPDGSRIERLPAASSAPAAVLSAEEQRQLTELNARILREQQAPQLHEQRLPALRHVPSPHGYGGPYLDGGWVWTRHGWAWRPRWGFGLGWYGAWPH